MRFWRKYNRYIRDNKRIIIIVKINDKKDFCIASLRYFVHER